MGIGLARSFLGLTAEIMKSDRFFVAVSESDRVERLFAYHRKRWETGLSPIDPKNRYMRERGRAAMEKTAIDQPGVFFANLRQTVQPFCHSI